MWLVAAILGSTTLKRWLKPSSKPGYFWSWMRMTSRHYGLNAFVPLKSTCWSLNPWHDGIWRWSLSEVIRVRLGLEGGALLMGLASLQEEEERDLFLSHLTPWGKAIWGHSETMAMWSQEESSHPEPDQAAAWSQTSSFQNCGNKFLLVKPLCGVLLW